MNPAPRWAPGKSDTGVNRESCVGTDGNVVFWKFLLFKVPLHSEESWWCYFLGHNCKCVMEVCSRLSNVFVLLQQHINMNFKWVSAANALNTHTFLDRTHVILIILQFELNLFLCWYIKMLSFLFQLRCMQTHAYTDNHIEWLLCLHADTKASMMSSKRLVQRSHVYSNQFFL